MKFQFHCPALSGNPLAEPLDFEWDEEAGTVSGASAEVIRAAAKDGGVPLNPLPAFHDFGPDPLRSRADMAAIIGYLHQLPEALAGDYPVVADEPGVVEVLDADGRVVETLHVVF